MEHGYPIAIYLAGKAYRVLPHISYDEYRTEALLGLHACAFAWNSVRGVPFLPFATCVIRRRFVRLRVKTPASVRAYSLDWADGDPLADFSRDDGHAARAMASYDELQGHIRSILPAREADIVVWHAGEGLPYRIIGARLSPPRTGARVAQIYERAMAQLRRRLPALRGRSNA